LTIARSEENAAKDPSPARLAGRIVMLGMAAAVGIGIARFAYSLILSDMRADLGWGYSQAGFLNTLNALGYLVGAIATPPVMARMGTMRTLRAGLALTIAGMAMMLGPPAMTLLSLGRIAAGVGAALAFIAGSTASASLAQTSATRRATLIGLFYVGPGLGMAFSGATTPFVLAHFGAGSWRIAWGWLTALACVLTVPAIVASGGEARMPQASRVRGRASVMPMAPMLVGYGLFAAGVIAYMTFVIAWVRGAGGSYALQAEFWTTIGIAAIAAPWLWGRLMERLHGGRAMAILVGVSAVGAALPLWLGASAATLLESAILFGSAVFAVVAATTVFVRRNVPQDAWGPAITAMTVAFGIGQTIGPVATGYVSDWSGGRLESGLWVSMVFLALGLVACARQRDLAARKAP